MNTSHVFHVAGFVLIVCTMAGPLMPACLKPWCSVLVFVHCICWSPSNLDSLACMHLDWTWYFLEVLWANVHVYPMTMSKQCRNMHNSVIILAVVAKIYLYYYRYCLLARFKMCGILYNSVLLLLSKIWAWRWRASCNTSQSVILLFMLVFPHLFLNP